MITKFSRNKFFRKVFTVFICFMAVLQVFSTAVLNIAAKEEETSNEIIQKTAIDVVRKIQLGGPAKLVYIIDNSTFVIEYEGKEKIVTLADIYVPNAGLEGEVVSDFLYNTFEENNYIYVEFIKESSMVYMYKRNGIMLNALLLDKGYAKIEPEDRSSYRYILQIIEFDAFENALGFWGEKSELFIQQNY